jgi:hypothetical protein
MPSNYPQEVENYVDAIADSLASTGFFEEYEIDPTLGASNFKKHASEACLGQWLKEGDAFIDDATLQKVLQLVIVDDSFSKLADAGLVNYYEDENGEEQFFLTAKGQEYADTMQL